MTFKYYEANNNTLPGYGNIQPRLHDNIDPDKEHFSAAPHDEEAYTRVDMDDHDNERPLGGPSSYTSPYGAPTDYASTSQVGSHYNEPENPFEQHENPFGDNDYRDNHAAGTHYARPSVHDETASFPTGNY
jgi:hypothetical protein